jgi:hypothetical protein
VWAGAAAIRSSGNGLDGVALSCDGLDWIWLDAEPGAVRIFPDELESRLIRFRSARISAAVWQRRSRSFSSAFMITAFRAAGRFPFSSVGAGGDFSKIAWKIKAAVDPSKGRFLLAIRYSTAPKLNKSLRGSSSSPRACSGDMYAMVPTVAPGLVRCRRVASAVAPAAATASSRSRASLAKPKSNTFARPREVMKMFAGLMSRWTMPLR